QEGLELARHYDIPVGLADDCETAELASLSARPGCTREVSSLTTAAFIDRLPLRFLKGVGLSEANYTRLQWLGVATAGDLARWSCAPTWAARGTRCCRCCRAPGAPSCAPSSSPRRWSARSPSPSRCWSRPSCSRRSSACRSSSSARSTVASRGA